MPSTLGAGAGLARRSRTAALALGLLVSAALPAAAKSIPVGDVDFDGNITIQDALLVLNLAVGLPSSRPINLEAADVSPSPGIGPRAGWRYGDGQVTIADALQILRAALGIAALGDNWPPPSLVWPSMFRPLNSGDGVKPGQPIWVTLLWEGPGPADWRVTPPDAGTFWFPQDDRSVLFTVGSPAGDVNFEMRAGPPQYSAGRLGAIRANLPDSVWTLTVATDRTEYPPLDPVRITVTVNAAAGSGLTTGTGVIVYAFDNETHREVWETRDSTWAQKVEVAGGASQTWAFSWNWKDLHGVFVQPVTYTLFARLGIDENIMSAPVEVTRIAVY